MTIGPKEAALRAQREAKTKRRPVTFGVTKAIPALTLVTSKVTTHKVCPACKRPFPMTPADRQRKHRAAAKG